MTQHWRTYTAKIPVQYLNEMMDDFKDFELIVIRINAHAEIQARVPAHSNYTQKTSMSDKKILLKQHNLDDKIHKTIAETYLLYTTL